MSQKIKALETIARQLEPDASQRHIISDKANTYANLFVDGLETASGYIKGDCKALKSLKFQEKGKDFEKLLAILKDEVDAIGINSASGGHLGYIPGGGLWASAIGDLLAAVGNRYAGVAYSSPGAVVMENQLIQWLCKLVGYPKNAHGNLTSGGSIANLIAVKAARDHHKINSTNVKKSVVYITQQCHHCIGKALNITGLHEAVLRTIEMNDRYQMEMDNLQKQIEKDKADGLKPFLVVASAGTTDTGAVDPLEAIAQICSDNKIWFHVDAAYGGFFMLVDEMKNKFKGIERSDSMVMDPHKTLFLPYGSGVVLVKNRDHLLDSNTQKANYMKDAYGLEETSPADCGPELSKHFRGLRMWLPLHLHGIQPFRANLEEKLLLCRYFHEKVGALGFETGPEPQLSVAMFRCPNDEKNLQTQQLIVKLHEDGRLFFSSTTIGEKLWIRCAVVSFRTHLREMELALRMVQEAAGK